MLENNTQNKKAVKSIVLRIDKKHRWAILVAFIISLIGHIIPVFTDWDFKWDEIEIVKQKPLSMKFVQRAPRLVKPMELRKKPKIVQRTFTKITQTQKSFKPRSMRTAAMHGGTVLASLARPTDPVQRILSIMPEDVPLGADISNTAVTVNKEQDLKSLDENLLNAGDMNYGRYNSYVTVDPDNKKNIKGFIKMGLLKYQAEFLDYGGMPDWNTSPNALQNLSEYLRDNSGIKAEHSFIFDLTDHEYIDKKVAFLLMTGHRNFKFSSEESKNIAEYVLKGGFLFIDDSDFRKGANFDMSARQLVLQGLGPDFEFEVIPNDHPVYSIFYNFNGLPAGDDQAFSGFSGDRPPGEHVIYKYLEGIFIEGRLAVVMCNKSYNNAWNYDPHWVGAGKSPVRQMQLGVNFIIYSLLQPGSFTQQILAYK